MPLSALPAPSLAAEPSKAAFGMILLGGGGHAVVVAEAAGLAGQVLAGFLDDDAAAALSATLLHPPLVDSAAMPAPPLAAVAEPPPRHIGGLQDGDLLAACLGGQTLILAIGNVAARRGVLSRVIKLGAALVCDGAARASGPVWANVVHPEAFVSASGELAIRGGIFVGPRAIVHSRARIAAHAIINSGCIVEHDCTIGENAHVAPGAVLGGDVSVGADTLVGLGARVLPGVIIGANCIIGAGAVVLRHVPDRTRVVGVWG